MLLDKLSPHQQDAISSFLIAYMKQTRRQTMSLPTFVNNVYKAYTLNKFGLREMIEYHFFLQSCLRSSEDNQLKEEELQNIVQAMESLSGHQLPTAAAQPKSRVRPSGTAKPVDSSKSLKDKIAEQKQKLRRQPNTGKEPAPRSKPLPQPKPPGAFQSHNPPSNAKPTSRPQTTRTNYHKTQVGE
jgi:hypothetical protein